MCKCALEIKKPHMMDTELLHPFTAVTLIKSMPSVHIGFKRSEMGAGALMSAQITPVDPSPH